MEEVPKIQMQIALYAKVVGIKWDYDASVGGMLKGEVVSDWCVWLEYAEVHACDEYNIAIIIGFDCIENSADGICCCDWPS